uniref:EB domain-containing protein n=1 Tax=Anopheles albimanus TaxID=7167 RepID=A0A182F790_ANOAL
MKMGSAKRKSSFRIDDILHQQRAEQNLLYQHHAALASGRPHTDGSEGLPAEASPSLLYPSTPAGSYGGCAPMPPTMPVDCSASGRHRSSSSPSLAAQQNHGDSSAPSPVSIGRSDSPKKPTAVYPGLLDFSKNMIPLPLQLGVPTFNPINAAYLEHYASVLHKGTANVCRTDDECPMQAYCERYNSVHEYGVCSCMAGYFAVTDANNTRRCLRAATDIGDYCLHNDQCHYTLSTDSECRDNSCQCREGAHYVEREKRCYKTSFLGDYCRLTNNCIGNGTYCRDGVCVCTPGKHANNDRNRCLKDAKLGDPCFRDEECVTDNSRCAQEICTCRVSHVLNEHRNRCLPIASKMYDLCEEHIQCLYNIPYSQCRITTGTDGITSGRCSCANRFHEMNLVKMLLIRTPEWDL